MSGFLETVRDAVLLSPKVSTDVKTVYREQNSSKSGRAEMHVLFKENMSCNSFKGLTSCQATRDGVQKRR